MFFVGRKQQLDSLQRLRKKRSASLVVIRGRRRIGKSRLAEEFAASFPRAFFFTGLPPNQQVTAEVQRQEFIRQMREQGLAIEKEQDWGDLFWELSCHCQTGPLLVVLDEISWMGSEDPTFLGKLKTAWDRHFKKNPQLVLLLSGSNSWWIQKNILSSTGFFGRVSLRINLGELSLPSCNAFWGKRAGQISAYDKFKILAVTGGIPRYLEEIDPALSAEENIYRLCFAPDGLLVEEFDEAFSDLFSHDSRYYEAIVRILLHQSLTVKEIMEQLNRSKGGDLSHYLEELHLFGFLSRDYSWHLKEGKPTATSRFRLSDNYVRFYLKYIEPVKQQILRGDYQHLPAAWSSILGLQFENLVIANRHSLYAALRIPLEELVIANPYFQTATKRRQGCQIDFLIQTRYNQLYVCEIKFSKREIEGEVVQEVQQKIDRLEIPRGFSIRPVLIHVNGVAESVEEADYFAHIVDFSQLLEGAP